jgi:hypothetical protein
VILKYQQHGQHACYLRGCRCVACRQAGSVYARVYRYLYAQRPDQHRHGTNGTYNNGCRCDQCRHAHNLYCRPYMRAWQRRRRAIRMGITPLPPLPPPVSTTAIIVEIPRVPSSPNYLRGKHWRVRHRETQIWKEEVYFAVRGMRPEKPYPKAKVTIDRRSLRKLDEDNLYGAIKPVLDALRYSHILLDDSTEHIQLTVTQSRGEPLTRIEVQPIT